MKEIMLKPHKYLYYILGCMMSCLTVFMVSGGVSCDVYFMINSAKAMLSEGFHYADSLSMFSDMLFYPQKWVMCFLTYFIFSIGGITALTIGMYVIGMMRSIMLFWMINVINPKSMTKNTLLSVFACLLLNVYSLDFRPSVIADCFLFLEIILLEKYIHNKLRKRTLFIGLAFISMCIMWFHSTMWLMCIIMLLPYMFDLKKFNNVFDNIGLNKLRASYCNKKPIIVSMLIVIVSGLFQPNGIYQFKYIIYSMLSTSSLKTFVQECKPISLNSGWAFVVLFLLFVCALATSQTNKIELRHLYLLIGTLIMTCTSQRLIEYFIPAAFIFIASCVNTSYRSSVKRIQESALLYTASVISITIASIMCLIINIQLLSSGETNKSLGYTVNNALLSSNNVDEQSTIYCSFELGSYLEYKGLHPYIDGRLEAFSYTINKTYPVLEEYAGTYKGNVPNVQYLKDKYSFDYYIVVSETTMEESLHYMGANELYDDGFYSIYSFEYNSL